MNGFSGGREERWGGAGAGFNCSETQSSTKTYNTRLDAYQCYQELQEKLSSQQPEVGIAEDHARQIGVGCSQEDGALVLSRVEDAKQQLAHLHASLATSVGQCRQIQQDRDDFEASMNETIAWLEEKEDVLASLRPLHLDSDKVDPVMDKHQVSTRVW